VLRGALAGVLLIALVTAAILVILGGSEEAGRRLAAPAPTDTASPGFAAANGGEADAGPIGSSLLQPTPEPREPTDADAVGFSARYEAPGGRPVEIVIADLDGDGHSEVIAAFVAGGATRIEVASWTGTAYEVGFTGAGGPAEELLAFEVHDVTGDSAREILTVQRTDARESLAIWGLTDEGIAPLTARGGCWDGSHVFGIDGAEVEAGELTATCPDTEDEDGALARGGQDVYTWGGQTWDHDETEPT
jgi:hypothetical protein